MIRGKGGMLGHHVAQAGLELDNLLLQPLKWWDLKECAIVLVLDGKYLLPRTKTRKKVGN